MLDLSCIYYVAPYVCYFLASIIILPLLCYILIDEETVKKRKRSKKPGVEYEQFFQSCDVRLTHILRVYQDIQTIVLKQYPDTSDQLFCIKNEGKLLEHRSEKLIESENDILRTKDILLFDDGGEKLTDKSLERRRQKSIENGGLVFAMDALLRNNKDVSHLTEKGLEKRQKSIEKNEIVLAKNGLLLNDKEGVGSLIENSLARRRRNSIEKGEIVLAKNSLLLNDKDGDDNISRSLERGFQGVVDLNNSKNCKNIEVTSEYREVTVTEKDSNDNTINTSTRIDCQQSITITQGDNPSLKDKENLVHYSSISRVQKTMDHYDSYSDLSDLDDDVGDVTKSRDSVSGLDPDTELDIIDDLLRANFEENIELLDQQHLKLDFYCETKSLLQAKLKCWPEGTVLLAGDSVLNDISSSMLSKKYDIKKKSFQGYSLIEMLACLSRLLRRRPAYVVLHLTCDEKYSSDTLRDLKMMKAHTLKCLPSAYVVICSPMEQSL